MGVSTILLLTSIGVCAGLMSGFIGVGGGIVIVPALVFIMGFTQHEAQGLSITTMLPPIVINRTLVRIHLRFLFLLFLGMRY